MFKGSLLALAALLGYASATVEHWAVLVAGSYTYSNYRHQADIFHAYQIMKNNGIDEDKIILFAYDDIAYSSENPFPGQVFNKPNGEDVYAGVKIDYSGSDVTPANVLKVLKGETMTVGTKKTLKSDSDDKVFFYFADHGAPGLIAFPKGQLYADDLNDAFNYMHDHKMYDEMTVYIEACESGSMFSGILSDKINIYATTAANPSESSWGTYCYPDDVVNGHHINSCLGDLYSVEWMEDTEAHNVKTETLEEQYETVKAKTTKSHVMQYGTQQFVSEPIGNFEGDYDLSATSTKIRKALQSVKPFKSVSDDLATQQYKHMSAINTRDAKLHHLYAKVMTQGTTTAQLELISELNHRIRVDSIFQKFALEAHIDVDAKEAPTNFECLKYMVNQYELNCGEMQEYELKYIQYFVNMCENLLFTAQVDPMSHLLKKSCQ